MIQPILQLGNPQLYEISIDVSEYDKDKVETWIQDLHDTLMDYRKTYGAGRAIALPQIGIKRRLIYAYLDKPYVFINPVLTFPNNETYIVMDDCMSFPGLMVKVRRYKEVQINYLDENFNKKSLYLKNDMAELLQHEYDHLDGILATQRAIDNKSFYLQQMKRDF